MEAIRKRTKDKGRMNVMDYIKLIMDRRVINWVRKKRLNQ